MKIYIGVIAFLAMGVVSAQKVWSFNDCLSYARENNLKVIASKLNEQVQESNYQIAKKQKLPDVSGSVDNNFSFGPTPQQRITYGSGGSSNFNIQNYYNYTEGYQNNLALQSSIILYNNGNLKRNEEKNSLLLQQYQFTTEKIKNEISLQLMGNYLTVLLNKELMIVDKNSLDNNQQQADRNQKLYNAGSIPLSTLYESNSNLATAKQVYETAKIEVDRSLMILAMLLQKDYRDFSIEEVKVSDKLELPLINVDDVIEYAYNHQPVIKSAEFGVEAAKKDIDIAKTALYPTISGGYKASTYYQDYFDRSNKSLTDQWYDNHSQMLSVGVNIPIFNKGISKLRIEQSKIQQSIQENQLEQEKLTLKQTIQAAYFDVVSSYNTFLSSKELVASTQLSYDFAQKSFSAGKINVYDLNIARNNYFNAQSQMLQSKYSFLFKLKILDFYTGKPMQITSNELIDYNYYNDFNPISENTPQTENTPVQNQEETKNSSDEKESIKQIDITTPNYTNENTTSSVPSNNQPENTHIVPEEKKADEENQTSDAPANSDNTKDSNSGKNPETEQVPVASPNDEAAKREAQIKERRAKLSQGSSDVNHDDSERERLIQERRAQLNKGK